MSAEGGHLGVETNKKITLGTISSTNFAEITKLIVVLLSF
jgi:hypothetical protein